MSQSGKASPDLRLIAISHFTLDSSRKLEHILSLHVHDIQICNQLSTKCSHAASMHVKSKTAAQQQSRSNDTSGSTL